MNKGPLSPLINLGESGGHAPPENFEIWKLWNTISSILGTKLSAEDKGRLLMNSNIFLYFYNTNSSLEKKHTKDCLPTLQTGNRNRD